jgi:hypothetical protein
MFLGTRPSNFIKTSNVICAEERELSAAGMEAAVVAAGSADGGWVTARGAASHCERLPQHVQKRLKIGRCLPSLCLRLALSALLYVLPVVLLVLYR